VRPGAADACDHALIAQEGVQPPRLLRADRCQRVRAETERLRPEMCKLLLRRLGRQQPDACALLRAGLREDELCTALELQPERRCLWAFLAGAQEAQAARGHQVDEQHEL